MAKHKVIQWGTGGVGMPSLEAILDHPDLELVGVVVHGADKDGVDAGVLCGRDPIGMTASRDADAVLDAGLAAGADVLAYHAIADRRSWHAVDDMCGALERGMNVTSTSIVPLVYPPAVRPEMVAKLEAACVQGNTTCLTTGVDPGFCNQVLPLVLSGCSRRIDSIRMSELLCFDRYTSAFTISEIFGFGRPMDYLPSMLAPGVLTWCWQPVIEALAAGLGVTVERYEEAHERRVTPTPIDTACGVIEPDTVAALRFELTAYVEGKPRFVIEHVDRMSPDLAPEWPQPVGPGGYRVEIEGDPTMVCDLTFADAASGDALVGGVVATSMQSLNAIPALVTAPPGVVGMTDLPYPVGTGAIR
jgi:4-hydroxy-tetrahydrodipicolinate reductase